MPEVLAGETSQEWLAARPPWESRPRLGLLGQELGPGVSFPSSWRFTGSWL